MKWIGQHIWDFISRFRSDVYLEATETGTIVSGGNLGLDSNNKVVKADEVGSSVDLASAEVTGVLTVDHGGTGIADGGASGSILTGDGTSALTVEPNITVDGSVTSGDILAINASALTTGTGVRVTDSTFERSTGYFYADITDTQVTTINRGNFGIFNVDYERPSGSPVSNLNSVTSIGMNIRMDDNAANVGGSSMIGLRVETDFASTGGSTAGLGIYTRCGGGDVAWDLYMENFDDSTEFATLAVGTGGKLDLTTNSDDTTGHLTLDVDGDIELNADGGSINFKDASAQLALISATGLDFTDNLNAGITFEGSTDDAHKTSLTVVDPTATNVIRLPNAGGTVQLEGTAAGKQLQVFTTSFFDNISTTKHYLPFKDINEQIYSYQDEVAMLAPCDGRIVSVTLRPHALNISSDATLTVGVHTKPVNVSITSPAFTQEETEALVVTNTGDDSDNHVFHFSFDNAKHFESTELFSVSLQSDVSPGNSFWHSVVVVEWDWTTFLGGTSAEITSTP